MPAGNPLGYIIPQIIPPGAGMMAAPAAAVGIDALASLLGVQPTAMSPIAGDIVRQGSAPVQPAMAPQNNTPAARGPIDFTKQDLSLYSPNQLAHWNAKYKSNPTWEQAYSDELARRRQAARQQQ